MPTHIPAPTIVAAAGTPPKRIEEFIGRVNSGTTGVSVARMKSPQGWVEPAQRPEFDEYTLVLAGSLVVEHDSGTMRVNAGEAVIVRAGERVRYGSPHAGGAEYVAVCIPAFSPEAVHREP
jgi:mannose-6-phosphate isomerase-like protein (cupin superfamily)